VNEDLKKWLPWILVGVLALALTGFIIAGLGVGDSVAGDTTTTVPSTTSTVTETTTTVPETTTSGVLETTTTTTAPKTTTTAPPETTTTTLAPVTTTTPAAAVVELSDEGIVAGTGWLSFGFNDEDAIVAVTAVLGAPTQDSGWIDAFSSPYGVCPAPVVRGVHWDQFVMLFTQAETDFWSGGVPHFYAYNYYGDAADLETTEGIAIGDTLAQLKAAYPGPKLEILENPFDPSAGFWIYDRQMWTSMSGSATGQADADTIDSINGGIGCGE